MPMHCLYNMATQDSDLRPEHNSPTLHDLMPRMLVKVLLMHGHLFFCIRFCGLLRVSKSAPVRLLGPPACTRRYDMPLTRQWHMRARVDSIHMK